MTANTIEYTLDAGLARVHINRPDKLNALTKDMRIALADHFERAARDPEVRALLITAEGKSFCSGADLEQFGAEGPASSRLRMQTGGHRLIKALNDIEKPVVIAVRGHVIGIGWAIAMACDIIIASNTAQFRLPFAKNGLVADTGILWFLTRQLGLLRAKDLIYSAKALPAQEAVSMGLATEMVDNATLEARALERAQELAAGPTFSLGLMRKLFAVAQGPTLAEYLEVEALMSPQLRHTEDFHEGVKAFKEKRKPRFTGK